MRLCLKNPFLGEILKQNEQLKKNHAKIICEKNQYSSFFVVNTNHFVARHYANVASLFFVKIIIIISITHYDYVMLAFASMHLHQHQSSCYLTPPPIHCNICTPPHKDQLTAPLIVKFCYYINITNV